MQISFFGASASRYREKLQVNRTKFQNFLVNKDHVQTKVAKKLVFFFEQAQIFADQTTPKLANTLAVIFSYSFGRRFVFINQISKQPFAEVPQNRCSQNFPKPAGKHLCRDLFLISLRLTVQNETPTKVCFFVNFVRPLNFVKTSRTTASVFLYLWIIFVISKNLIFIGHFNWPVWFFPKYRVCHTKLNVIFQVILTFFLSLLNIINFDIFTIQLHQYNFLILQKISRMRTSLTTLNFNMFVKKEIDVKKYRLGKIMKTLSYKTYLN